jgi:hypothetical protein
MFWIVQNNLFNEMSYNSFIAILEDCKIQHQIVKVIPFSRELEPTIDPPQPCIIMGGTTLSKIAAARGWVPGTFYNTNFDSRVWLPRYGEFSLNSEALTYAFENVPEQEAPFFARGTDDNKSFSGKVFESWEEFDNWRMKVISLRETYSTLSGSTPVIVGPAYNILEEYRHWFVNGELVTSSRYKRDGRLSVSQYVDENILDYARQTSAKFQPARAYVVDTAVLAGNEQRVIEINNINSAGLYGCDIEKLVRTLDSYE